MTIKVRMVPHLQDLEGGAPSGVQKVVEKYFQYLPKYDVEMVGPKSASYDLLAIHAGATDKFAPNDPIVAMNHGLYWTGDYQAADYEIHGNKAVINVLRHAVGITVPSPWVAEAFARDMHVSPGIVPHGVDFVEWQGGEDQGWILWNKNRPTDVCDPTPVNELAKLMPNSKFITTFAADAPPSNVKVIGSVPHKQMRALVMSASLYLATTKETFGIGTLEAMASGVPILGFDHGGTADLVIHGRTGYLAQPGDYEELLHGANYLLRRRQSIGRNARDYARAFSWDHAVEILAAQYALTLAHVQRPDTVAVVIPVFNKSDTLERAVASVQAQRIQPDYIVIVDNNSTDNTREVAFRLMNEARDRGESNLSFMNCEAQGVAHARNAGIEACPDATYIVCLDADDEIKPGFMTPCLRYLGGDNSLAIAYTGIEAVRLDGSRFVSQWPGQYDFDGFLQGRNQVPTCCMFRREMWRRAGGFRQRFAPGGAGSEDADLWLRIGALGGRGQKVAEEGLFVYYLGGQVSGDPNYQEVNWRGGKPWVEDGRHPFASMATPANGVSHLVRQVDQPLISVIIPCGPGHSSMLVDCLDSVEAQTCRQWEVIVAADVDQLEWQRLYDMVHDGYPFVRLTATPSPGSGAGVARNTGAELARSPLLVFLDADDTLTPGALNAMLAGYMENPLSIIYGDYIGHAYLPNDHELQRLRAYNRLLHYDEKTTMAQVLYRSLEYDCPKAMEQPDARKPYIWNIISSLVPRAFHKEVGGFDETMESWEDWDYWLRLARAGKCFTRIDTPVLDYKFYTGRRRALANPTESGENGRQLSETLLQYMQSKYERTEAMPCRSCGGGGRSRRAATPLMPSMAMTMNEGGVSKMAGDELVWVKLNDGNIGSHRIIFQRENYGYRSHGELFKMRADHVAQDNRVILATGVEIAEATGQPLPTSVPNISSQQLIQVPAEAKRVLPSEEPRDWGPEGIEGKDGLDEPELDASFIGGDNGGTTWPDDADEDDVVDQEANSLGLKVTETARIVTPDGKPVKAEDVEAGVTLVPVKAIFDFTTLWGIGAERQAVLIKKGVRSLSGLIALDVVGIQTTLEVPEGTAERILKAAKAEAAK